MLDDIDSGSADDLRAKVDAIRASSEAVDAAELLLETGGAPRSDLLNCLLMLSVSLLSAGRWPAAAATATRALALVDPDYVRANPEFEVEHLVVIVAECNRSTQAHIALLETAVAVDPHNMSARRALLYALRSLATQQRDLGLHDEAHGWMLRAVNEATLLRTANIDGDLRRLIRSVLELLWMDLGEESIQERTTIVGLLNDIEPGSGDFLYGLE